MSEIFYFIFGNILGYHIKYFLDMYKLQKRKQEQKKREEEQKRREEEEEKKKQEQKKNNDWFWLINQ